MSVVENTQNHPVDAIVANSEFNIIEELIYSWFIGEVSFDLV